MMTDSQIVHGVLKNDDLVWKYIYKEYKARFVSILRREFLFLALTHSMEDVFTDSCMVLMDKVKSDAFVVVRNGGLFSFLVSIGRGLAQNMRRKKRPVDELSGEKATEGQAEDRDVSVDRQQQEQNEFLDRVFDSIPGDCKRLLIKFYWEHKPMDELAGMMGLKNADTAKTKKNRCMNKFKEIAKMLVSSDQFAEEVLRACAERAALKELFASERTRAKNTGIVVAAYKVKDKEKDSKKSPKKNK